MSKMYYYNVECYPNYFTAMFIDSATNKEYIQGYIDSDIKNDNSEKMRYLNLIAPVVFIIDDTRNDTELIVRFFNTHKILVGFNNRNYDNTFIDFLIINHKKISGRNLMSFNGNVGHINNVLYLLSSEIVNSLHPRRVYSCFKYYKAPYTSIDLMTAVYETVERKSLAQTSIILNWYKIWNQPIDVDSALDNKGKVVINTFNINQVLITREMFINKRDELLLRVDLSLLYNMNLYSANRSSIADRVFTKFYLERTGKTYNEIKDLRSIRRVIKFNDIIDNTISFKTPELQRFLTKLKTVKHTLGVDKFEYHVAFSGVTYSFMLGGLHSEDKPAIFRNDKYLIMDADVNVKLAS